MFGVPLRFHQKVELVILTLIDDYFKKVWMYPLKHKNDVFPTFKQWKVMIEKQIGKKVKRLRTDNGMVFCSMEFD